MEALGERTIRNSLYGFLSYVIPIFFALVLTPLIINRLGVEAYGIFILANILAGMFSLLKFGMSYGVTKIVSEYMGDQTRAGVSEIVNSTLMLLIGVGLIGAASMLCIGAYGADLLHISPALAPTLLTIFAIGAITFFLTTVSSVFSNALVAAHRADKQAQVYLIGMGLMNAAMLCAVLLQHGLVALMLIQAVAAFGILFFYYRAVRRALPSLQLALQYSHQHFAPVMLLNGYAYIHEASSSLLIELDKVVLTAFLGPVAVSYYSIAGTISQKIQGAVASLTSIFLPVSSSIVASGDRGRIQPLYRQVVTIALAIAIGLGVTAAAFGRPLLQYWVGVGFVEAALVPLYILCATYVLLSLYTTIGHFLLGMGQVRFLAFGTASLTLLNVILLAVGIPLYGITGAAWAYLLSFLPLPFLIMKAEQRILGSSADTFAFFARQSGTLLVVGGLYGAGSLLLAQFASSLLLVLMLGGVSLIGYAILLRASGLIAPEHWQRVFQVVQRTLHLRSY